MYRRDTIVAPATPPGRGAVAVVRLSGDDAFEILERMFSPHAPGAPLPWQLRYGTLATDRGGDPIDEVLAVRMPGPRSYTGEDVAEIQCHGSPIVCERIVRAAVVLGARAAERGEFTRRAVLNGRIDLVQAEAVADLIDSRMEAGARTAWDQLQGALSRRLDALREEILEVLAEVEAGIDFADEDLPLPQLDRQLGRLDAAHATIDALLSGFPAAHRRREGYATVFAGRPNVGKSSLMNALLGHGRMIVCDEPGTTRDSVEEAIDLGRAAFVLTDTAGLRAAPGRAEEAAVARARGAAASADVLVVVLDGSRPFTTDELEMLSDASTRRSIFVVNKSDLPAKISARDRALLQGSGRPVVDACAIAPGGVDALCSALQMLVEDETAESSGSAAISRVRHRTALERAKTALADGRALVAAGEPPELAAVELRAALAELAAITHPLDNEEILDRVFSTFCIGK